MKTGGDRYELFLTLILLTLLVSAVFVDIWKSIIPNRIVLMVLAVQVGSALVSCSMVDAADRFYRLLTRCLIIIFLIFFIYIFFSIGAIGAGDLKLLAATAVGFESPAMFIAVTFIIAAVMSLVHAIRKGVLIKRMRYLVDYINYISKTNTITGYSDAKASLEERKEYSIHLSLPILLAALLACYVANYL